MAAAPGPHSKASDFEVKPFAEIMREKRLKKQQEEQALLHNSDAPVAAAPDVDRVPPSPQRDVVHVEPDTLDMVDAPDRKRKREDDAHEDAVPAATVASPSVGPSAAPSVGDATDVDKDSVMPFSAAPSRRSTPESERTPPRKRQKTEAPKRRRLPTFLQGCRTVECYKQLNVIDEGQYGVVSRCMDKETGEVVALKQLKLRGEAEGYPITSLREIKTFTMCRHPNIVNVKEVVVSTDNSKVFMVMEYVDHELSQLYRDNAYTFSISEVKCLMQQLLRAVAFMHDNWVLHRDLKSSNLLYNNRGQLKVADFGMAREYGSPLKPYTQLVITMWYRPPELLLGATTYSTAVDMWSVGCIFAEFVNREVLFKGTSEMNQLDEIFKLLGTPNEDIWPGYSDLPNAAKWRFASHPFSRLRKHLPRLTEAGINLLEGFLTFDPQRRLSAAAALDHAWFRESPPPQDPAFMPTFPSANEDGKKRSRKPAAPRETFVLR